MDLIRLTLLGYFILTGKFSLCTCSGFGYELLSGKMEALESHITNIGRRLDQLSESLQNTQQVYTSCDRVPSKASGVYNVKVNLRETLDIFCDQKYDGGGWTVIQRRFDGSVNFYRDWNEYKRGFGNLEGEFWLGLDVIHQLTYSAPHELVVLLEDFEGNSTFAKLDRFEVAGEQTSYTATMAAGFSGPAGDSITGIKDAKFTTLDKDNDTWYNNCAVTFHGAWWYTACHASNLNGKYLKGVTKEYAKGMVWNTFRGHYYTLKSSKMMIRRKKA
ncbi:ficolin-1-like [Ochlerotatus camptorhynchus]|uniref:ficolin-1-like n=1 Tax=Ochlerotatus camptorhynchus TaxID=644619 RepID=UPI0031D50D2E